MVCLVKNRNSQAADADAEPPNNVVRYELIHGNYENKFYLNETSGELILRSPITKIRRKKQSTYDKFAKKAGKEFVRGQGRIQSGVFEIKQGGLMDSRNESDSVGAKKQVTKRRKRDGDDALYTLTARAYDLGERLGFSQDVGIEEGFPENLTIYL